MNGLNTRFEQRRGLWMILERKSSPWRMDELDAVQTGMLQACEVPGLLPLAVEETDGRIALRYRLAGSKMLSQMLRTERWTMTDAMAALCKLAETAEQCHDHMLDFKRLLLKDEYIFVGSGWHDLRFAYLPLAADDKADDETGLERLIVRWVMRAEHPDGPALQQLLEMTASEEFAPSTLRAYARQYLCERAEERAGRMSQAADRYQGASERIETGSEPHGAQSDNKAGANGVLPLPELLGSPLSYSPVRMKKQVDDASWHRRNSFEPERGERIAAVEDAEDAGAGNGAIPGGMSVARWWTWLVSLSVVAAGIVWKIVYADAPAMRGLVMSLGATAACAGLCLFFWNGWPRKERSVGDREFEAGSASGEPEPDRFSYFPSWPEPEAEAAPRAPEAPPFARFESYSDNSGNALEMSERDMRDRPQTEWLSARREATELLASPQAAGASAECYLEWESAERPCKIPLKAESLVIGRSRDAAQHVDESGGMSRAHLEMLRRQGRWLAKDLGSRNGSWLNGSPMVPYEAYPLEAGDCLQMAGSIYRFHAPSEPLRA